MSWVHDAGEIPMDDRACYDKSVLALGMQFVFAEVVTIDQTERGLCRAMGYGLGARAIYAREVNTTN